MNHPPPASVVLEYVKHINAQDLEGLMALMTEDHTFIDYEGAVTHGREIMREGWAGYFSAYPEYEIHVQHVLTGGNGVAIIGQTTGSHIAPEVEEKETVLWTAEIRDGRVAEWRIYADSAEAEKAFEAYRAGSPSRGRGGRADRSAEGGVGRPAS